MINFKQLEAYFEPYFTLFYLLLFFGVLRIQEEISQLVSRVLRCMSFNFLGKNNGLAGTEKG